MGSNGNGRHGTSREVMVLVGKDEETDTTNIAVHDANSKEALVMILVPDDILYRHMSEDVDAGGDVLRSLKQLLETCFGAVIQSMDDVLNSQ